MSTRVGQEILVLRFEPPAQLELLISDPAVPRTGPAVLLVADCIDLDRWRAEPLEPQQAGWTEIALGYHCEARGEPATAFHFPFLLLSGSRGDNGMSLADVELTRFHAACPDFDGPAAGRRVEATARTFAGAPLAEVEATLERAAPGELPAGLLRWVNRVSYPDVTLPGAQLDAGLWLVPAQDCEVADEWVGRGSATLGAAIGWSGVVEGEAWHYGTVFTLDAVEAL